jgi:hypothetical protein
LHPNFDLENLPNGYEKKSMIGQNWYIPGGFVEGLHNQVAFVKEH